MLHKYIVLYQNDTLVAKFTVEELKSGLFISTQWDTSDCLEVDRTVVEFETYSAALASMYENALNFAVQLTPDLGINVN